jgi:hypothetical protein
MKDKQSIAQFLKVKSFPFIIKDDKGNQIYYEESSGYWSKCEYDNKNNEIYFENSNGYWCKRVYDDRSNTIYYEDSDGTISDNRSKPVIELTLEDIAKIKGVDISQIRIKE